MFDVNPIVSVVIVNYNGLEYLDRCIQSVLDSTLSELEIIVVDNGSSDGSIQYMKNKYIEYLSNKLLFIELDNNYGPARARNIGVESAKGKYLCFLDNDTRVHSDWATPAIKEFEKNKDTGIIQCKLMLESNHKQFDYIGEYIGSNGFLIQRVAATTIDSGEYDYRAEILAAKSAGMFIRKSVFDKINGFDDDYFIYVEETDLGWRSWLSGYKAVFVYNSIIYHEFGTSSIVLGESKNNYNAKFHGSKNYILTNLKNLSTVNLLKILPIHILLWIGIAWFSLLQGQLKSFLWIHYGIIWNIFNIRKTIRKRRIIQNHRKVKDDDLMKIVMQKRPFSYFFNKVITRQRIGNAAGFTRRKNEK
jgi:GT2 family glycosyltransferase